MIRDECYSTFHILEIKTGYNIRGKYITVNIFLVLSAPLTEVRRRGRELKVSPRSRHLKGESLPNFGSLSLRPFVTRPLGVCLYNLDFSISWNLIFYFRSRTVEVFILQWNHPTGPLPPETLYRRLIVTCRGVYFSFVLFYNTFHFS